VPLVNTKNIAEHCQMSLGVWRCQSPSESGYTYSQKRDINVDLHTTDNARNKRSKIDARYQV
jgi:hypothetical protein